MSAMNSNPCSVALGALLLCLVHPVLAQEGAAAPPASDEVPDTRTQVVDPATLTGLDALVTKLADRRVVFVGESHDRYEDHLNQLAIIRGLHEQDVDLAIGMEMFQQPFQPALDAYIAGEINEEEMLRRTDYFERWRFDYRLYRPILRYAREHGIPIIALNLDGEITAKVGKAGLEGLDEGQRTQVPVDMGREDPAYRERIKQVFDRHPQEEGKDFENFLLVQLLWDEGMAARAATYLEGQPGKTLVVLAGQGHLEYGQGIPKRLLRRLPVASAILLNGWPREMDPKAADYLLFPQPLELPATGRLGVMLDTDGKGSGVGVQGFGDKSGAAAAGIKEGDRIVRVGGKEVALYADIRLALIDSLPGQKLPVEVERLSAEGQPERLTLEVELH
ncbi:MAG: ChaN family lipoprotein [Chromatiaceae bacterium]|nr:ChaN family lipoprotein [Chromatiaceae bacterium]MBP9603151.1 ChaN family lipoprotein [Chromatiaceae bacterium]